MATGKTKIKKRFCYLCDNELPETEFYTSSSKFFPERMILCKKCLERIYNNLVDEYKTNNSENPEKEALYKVCQKYDVYYSDDILKTVLKNMEQKTNANTSLVLAYFKIAKMISYNKRTFDDTIAANNGEIEESSNELGKESKQKEIVSRETKLFFGSGFSLEDYRFLQDQYSDWIARHECKTKAQEEVFKQICFAQLNILKAQRDGEDTKNLVDTFQKLLDTAKLQPKQNHNETLSDAQTFGTLIDKWENTRPIPEPDDDLKDVNKIGKYLNIFFRGHLAKAMGLKNGFSKSYEEFMDSYSVKKPEYNSDEENSEALFDAVFGGDL